jgi:hypothetical protein
LREKNKELNFDYFSRVVSLLLEGFKILGIGILSTSMCRNVKRFKESDFLIITVSSFKNNA